MIVELNNRSREIFKHIVDSFMANGEPVGSRTLSRKLEQQLSPATIRNVMADLEDMGLLRAPHTSAGRIPTDAGLQMYVEGLLEVGSISGDDRAQIESNCAGAGRSVESVLGDVVETLSGLSHHAGIVMAPTTERPFRHIEFVPLSAERALVITVNDNGVVENRLIELSVGMRASTLIEAGNYLSARLNGRTFQEARLEIEEEIATQQSQLDELTRKVVEAGIATWSDGSRGDGMLLVRGQANLLDDIANLVDLEHIRQLFQALESKRGFLDLIEISQNGRGLQIFIGAQSELFAVSGCSMIIAPYKVGEGQSATLGAVGVIGPTRMNYSRIIPMVDHTARAVSRLLGSPDRQD